MFLQFLADFSRLLAKETPEFFDRFKDGELTLKCTVKVGLLETPRRLLTVPLSAKLHKKRLSNSQWRGTPWVAQTLHPPAALQGVATPPSLGSGRSTVGKRTGPNWSKRPFWSKWLYSELDFRNIRETKMDQNGPFWPEEVHFGPLVCQPKESFEAIFKK